MRDQLGIALLNFIPPVLAFFLQIVEDKYILIYMVIISPASFVIFLLRNMQPENNQAQERNQQFRDQFLAAFQD